MKNIEKMIAQKYFELEMFIYLLRLKKNPGHRLPILLYVFTCTVPREIFQNLYFQKYFISAIRQYNLIINRHGAYFLKTICVSSTCQRGQPFGWTPLGVSVRPTQLS